MSNTRLHSLTSAPLLVAAALIGCADSTTGPRSMPPTAAASVVQSAAPAADVTGTWTFHEEATFLLYDATGHASVVYRCSSDGTYTLVQTGSTFSGSFDQVGTCTAADGTSFPNNFSDVGVSGTIQGRHLRYADDVGCFFEGTLRGATLAEMGGSVRCGGGGIFGTYRGHWSATR